MKHKAGATSHGIPQVPRNWKRQRTRPPWSVWRERSKADTLILGFWNSDCERINVILSHSLWSIVLETNTNCSKGVQGHLCGFNLNLTNDE